MCSAWQQKLRFIKEQEASGLLLVPNSPLNKIHILGAIFSTYEMDGRNQIHFLARNQTGTNLIWKITGKLSAQLSDKFSALI